MDKKIENYIKRANESIHKVIVDKKLEIIKNKISEKRNKIINNLNLNNPFLTGSDMPQNKEDIEILKKVLEIDDKIVYLTTDLESVYELKQSFKDRVFGVEEDSFILAFIVDIHFFLWDAVFLEILKEHNKAFNTVHFKDYPTNNAGFLAFWTKERQEFINNKYSEKLEEIIYYGLSKTFSLSEVKHILSNFKEEHFFNVIKYVLNDKNKLNSIFRLNYKHYLFDQRNNKKSRNTVTNFFKNVINS